MTDAERADKDFQFERRRALYAEVRAIERRYGFPPICPNGDCRTCKEIRLAQRVPGPSR